nr:MAG TPA: hypothetical protein [Caudoviricetes sp.]
MILFISSPSWQRLCLFHIFKINNERNPNE